MNKQLMTHEERAAYHQGRGDVWKEIYDAIITTTLVLVTLTGFGGIIVYVLW